jgi:Zn-dependent M28 family amino/carboxypeptidase
MPMKPAVGSRVGRAPSTDSRTLTGRFPAHGSVPLSPQLSSTHTSPARTTGCGAFSSNSTTPWPRSPRPPTSRFEVRWRSTQQNGTLQNVVALLPGQDAAHQHDAIVIGAHRDHFGKQGGLLFAGADDNASGTAVILEVARVLTSIPVGPKRSIIVVSFSGEEQGLLGSKLYVTQPIVPLTATAAMINVDHAAVGNGRLTIGVTGLEKPAAQQAGERAGLADRIDLFGFFPGGDHVPFKEAGVPTVTVVSGGIHPHFHQPTDTADTVNADILSAAARYILAIAWQLADAP